jgi:carbonic anhydrase/acetyltransferase-like protein (isoleucine patch superfamily)
MTWVTLGEFCLPRDHKRAGAPRDGAGPGESAAGRCRTRAAGRWAVPAELIAEPWPGAYGRLWALVHHGRMPLFAFEGREPKVSPQAWIAPTATLVGDVLVEADASIWYGAVLRADFGPIVVRRGANVQDGSVLHGGSDPVTEIGEGATVGHLCVVHGAVVHEEALIGNGATVLDGAVVGRHALVAAGCTVPPGMVIPEGMLAVGVPARVVGEISGGAKEWVETNPEVYRELARRHAASVRPVT